MTYRMMCSTKGEKTKKKEKRSKKQKLQPKRKAEHFTDDNKETFRDNRKAAGLERNQPIRGGNGGLW